MNLITKKMPGSIEISGASLRLSDNITDEEIAHGRQLIEEAGMHINWIFGDFYSEVARVRPNKHIANKVDDGQLHFTLQVEQTDRVQAMIDGSQQSRSLARTVCRVSAILSADERIPNLSWGHHECALAECNLLGGENLEGGEYEKRKGEAIAFLKWAEQERRAGELTPVKEFRKVIRMRLGAEEPQQDQGPAFHSPAGDVLRESVRFAQCIHRLDPSKLQAHERQDLANALQPLVEFHKKLIG